MGTGTPVVMPDYYGLTAAKINQKLESVDVSNIDVSTLDFSTLPVADPHALGKAWIAPDGKIVVSAG